MRTSLLLICLLNAVFGYSQKKDMIALATYKNSDFEISYPKKWDLDTVLHYPDVKINDRYSHPGLDIDVISIFSQSIPSNYDNFDNFIKDCEAQVKEVAYDSVINEKLVVQNNRSKYFKIIYTSELGNTCKKNEQRFYLTKNKIFVMTSMTELEFFDSDINNLEKVMDSFILKVK